MQATQGLTNLQLELLKLFSFNLSEQQLKDVKALLAEYFANQATQEIDKLWDENEWSETTIQQWSQEHLRTKYES